MTERKNERDARSRARGRAPSIAASRASGAKPTSSKPSARGFESIESLLDGWLKRADVKKRVDTASLYAKWPDIVGARIAEKSRIVDLKRGELLVEVSSPALLGELSTYFAEEILASVQASGEFGGVRSIRFRSGSF